MTASALFSFYLIFLGSLFPLSPSNKLREKKRQDQLAAKKGKDPREALFKVGTMVECDYEGKILKLGPLRSYAAY